MNKLNRQLHHLIAMLDILLNNQLNLILHHPRLQQLEASWRGLYYLIRLFQFNNTQLKLKILNVTWQALAKDIAKTADFEQSQLFIKIYHHEFGHPGGEPFGLLIGDYYLCQHPVCNTDIDILASIAKVAAAAFCPFITGVDPSLFGIKEFAELNRPFDLSRLFLTAKYQQWYTLRTAKDACFLGLVMPRVLLRLPYTDKFDRKKPSFFQEDACMREHYLWGNASYCFAALVLHSFNRTGWFTDIYQDEAKGIIPGLKRHSFTTDQSHILYKYATDVAITDKREQQLRDAGFMVVMNGKYTKRLAFHNCISIYQSATTDNNNLQIHNALPYLLCASRFAHFIKIIARDKIGNFTTALACEHYLQEWLRQYTAAYHGLTSALKAQYPLREATVTVRELLGKPGSFSCLLHLKPHAQFHYMELNLHLTMELTRK